MSATTNYIIEHQEEILMRQGKQEGKYLRTVEILEAIESELAALELHDSIARNYWNQFKRLVQTYEPSLTKDDTAFFNFPF